MQKLHIYCPISSRLMDIFVNYKLDLLMEKGTLKMTSYKSRQSTITADFRMKDRGRERMRAREVPWFPLLYRITSVSLQSMLMKV